MIPVWRFSVFFDKKEPPVSPTDMMQFANFFPFLSKSFVFRRYRKENILLIAEEQFSFLFNYVIFFWNVSPRFDHASLNQRKIVFYLNHLERIQTLVYSISQTVFTFCGFVIKFDFADFVIFTISILERSKLLAHVSSHKRQKLQLFLNLEKVVTLESCTCSSVISSQSTGLLTLFFTSLASN